MKSISKKQADYIKKQDPSIHITTTSGEHTGKCKRYLVEDSFEVFKLLQEFKTNVERVIEQHGLVDEEYWDSKTSRTKVKRVQYK